MDDQKFSEPALIGESLESTGNGAVEKKKRRGRGGAAEASSFDGSIQKKRGRVGVGEAEAGAPRFDESFKKKRGAQPGNTNALKHGLYVHHRAIRNTNPVEKAALYDLTDHIQHMKDYLVHLYEIGMKSTKLEEINNTARSLAVGYIALGRLIHIHDANSSISLPDDLLGVDLDDEDYRPGPYQDPSLAEIVSKLKKLIAQREDAE
jgi:YD repeat-containing protein